MNFEITSANMPDCSRNRSPRLHSRIHILGSDFRLGEGHDVYNADKDIVCDLGQACPADGGVPNAMPLSESDAESGIYYVIQL